MDRMRDFATFCKRRAATLDVQRTVFWMLVLLLSALSLAGHYLQNKLSYDHSKLYRKLGYELPQQVRHGSYGYYLLRIRDKQDGVRRVFLLGNSVYQTTGIGRYMQGFAREEGHALEFVNLAQTGAGIHDYLVQLAKISRHQPDLVVLSFINLAFTADYVRRKALPRFRTDSDQTAFDPKMLQVIPATFYFREFGPEDVGRSVISTLFPLRRLDWYLQIHGRRELHSFIDLPRWVDQQFPTPQLNLAAEWLAHDRVQDLPRFEKSAFYPDVDDIIHDLRQLVLDQEIPLLFLRQESGRAFDHPDVMPKLRKAFAGVPHVVFQDLKDEFRQELFSDNVHPSVGEPRLLYSRRHYLAVVDALGVMLTWKAQRHLD